MRSVDRETWSRRKAEFHARMREDRVIGYLDPGIEEVLEEFFRRPGSYTTSSCSGRVTLVDAPWPWSRRDSTVVLRTHDPVTREEVLRILRQPVLHVLWLVAVGPIIHVEALDMEEAFRILDLARRAGFKHSGILSVSEKGVLVELRTGIRIAAPLRRGERILVSMEALDDIIEMANAAVLEGRQRLERLARLLREANNSSPIFT